jgi:hypothetical protein
MRVPSRAPVMLSMIAKSAPQTGSIRHRRECAGPYAGSMNALTSAGAGHARASRR